MGLASSGGGSLDEPGLAALRERAASIGATLAIVTEPGRGHPGTLLPRRVGTSEPMKGANRVSIRVLLADDHRMLREGLRRSLVDEGFDVVGEADNGEQAVRLAAELQPDVILMDVSMPEMDGVEATRQIRATGTEARVLMLTMHADKDVLADAIRAGAVRLPREGLLHRGGRRGHPHGRQRRHRPLPPPGRVDARRGAAPRGARARPTRST